MLDPQIASENKKTMTRQELENYFDAMTLEIDSYIYDANDRSVITRDFNFDAMSAIAWRTAFEIAKVPYTPFQPIGRIKSPKIEKKKLRKIGELCHDMIKKARKSNVAAFVRTDVSCSHRTLRQFHQGHMYPGLKRGLVKCDRIEIDDELRVAQYLSPNPEYIFHVQIFYPDEMYNTYVVEEGKVTGPDEHIEFVRGIVEKLDEYNLRPRHPQYNEHGTKDISFNITTVNGTEGPEVFTATGLNINDGRKWTPNPL